MVRPTSQLWIHFVKKTETAAGGVKKLIAKCKYCAIEYRFPNITRLRKHLKTCSKCPSDVRKAITDDDQEQEHNPDDVLPVSASTETAPGTPGPISPHQASGSKRPSQPQITPPEAKTTKGITVEAFLDHCSEQEKEVLDMSLARAIYSSGSSLSLLENNEWKVFLSKVRPSYTPPSRHMLSNSLLEAEYNRVMAQSKEMVKNARCLTLMSDGWKNIRGEAVINFMVATPHPVFFDSVVPGTNRETSDYISAQIMKVLEEIGPDKFSFLLTDNARNMKRAWELVIEQHPHIQAYGCVCHSLNLLLSDMLKLGTFMTLRDQAKSVVKTFKRRSVEQAAFCEKQKEKYGSSTITLKLPSNTRWSGLAIMLESMISNKSALQETVINETLNIHHEVRTAVLDNHGFWKEINNIVDIMKPVAASIQCLESDKAIISDVPKELKDIQRQIFPAIEKSHLQGSEKKFIKAAFKKRWNFCCKALHNAAFLLDPRYCGTNLSAEDKDSAISCIEKMATHMSLDAGVVIANLADYTCKERHFKKEVLWNAVKHTHPAIWWKGLCSDEALSPIAVILLSAPPSSAACERNWSLHGNIHTKKRNRLTNHRVRKLVCIQANYQLQRRKVGSTGKADFSFEEEEQTEEEGSDVSIASSGQEDEGEVMGICSDGHQSDSSDDDDQPLISYVQRQE